MTTEPTTPPLAAPLSARKVADTLGIPVADVDKPMTAPAAARAVRVELNTWWSYVTRANRERAAGRDRPGLAPAAAGREPITGRAYWMPRDVAAYKLAKPGPGSRTDMQFNLPPRSAPAT